MQLVVRRGTHPYKTISPISTAPVYIPFHTTPLILNRTQYASSVIPQRHALRLYIALSSALTALELHSRAALDCISSVSGLSLDETIFYTLSVCGMITPLEIHHSRHPHLTRRLSVHHCNPRLHLLLLDDSLRNTHTHYLRSHIGKPSASAYARAS